MPEPAAPDPPLARLPRIASPGPRRAASQAGLLAAMLVVFIVCATTAGACSLLLTVGNQRALSAAVGRADGNESTSGADLATVTVVSAPNRTEAGPRAEAATLVPLTRRVLLDAAQPYRAEVSLWTATPMLFVEGRQVRRGYLLDADSLPANATLRSGAWPTAPAASANPIPVAIPEATARALGASPGARIRLSEEREGGRAVRPYFDLVVTGVFDPSGSPAWKRDPLQGRGYTPNYLRLATFGPFVVAPGTLEALAAPIERIAAVLDPDLEGDAAGVPAMLRGVAGVDDRIAEAAGPAISPVLVWSPFTATFEGMRAELGISNALVLAVLLLVLTLGVTTAALVSRALIGRRGAEFTLLRDRGASGRQLVRGAAIEAGVVAALAAVASAPLAVAAYGLLAPGDAQAVRSSASAIAIGLGAVLAGALLPAVAVVLTTLPERPRRGRQVLSGPLARSGVDVMVALLAAVTYVQLRSHLVSSAAVDPLLVVAPAVCVIAIAALATRLVPLAARAANALAARSRGVVFPMAGWHLARAGATSGAFLLVLATAVSTLGVTFLATWSASQAEQAAAAVGADLVVGRPGGPGTGRRLADATGGTATPVADRAVVLGSRPEGVRLVALDSALADQMLRGRLPGGGTWSEAMSGLAAPDPDSSLGLAAGPIRLTLTGGLSAGSVGSGLVAPNVTATPTVVLVDAFGYRTSQIGTALPLDGRPHRIELPLPAGGSPTDAWRVVAVDLHLVDHSTGDLLAWGSNSAAMQVSVSIAGASAVAGRWGASADSGEGGVRPVEVKLRDATIDAAFTYSVLGLSWEDAHLTLLSSVPSTQVPVAMTEDLANELGLAPGDRIALTWDTTPVEAALVRTVPYVPSSVREPALLADLNSLSRAMLSAGRTESPTDVWWVGLPRAGAAETLRAAGSGPISTTAEAVVELRDSPLRTPLLTVWTLAIAAAVGLGVAGSAAHAAADAQRHTATIARVRAIGVPRRDALALHLVQHAGVTAAAVALGSLSGAILAWLLTPVLVVANRGQRAIPPVELVWPPAPIALVVGAILLSALVAAVPPAIALVRRSTVAALRSGDAP